jgi:hypothetical protein
VDGGEDLFLAAVFVVRFATSFASGEGGVLWLKGDGGCGRVEFFGVLRLRPVRLACGSLRGFAQDDSVIILRQFVLC